MNEQRGPGANAQVAEPCGLSSSEWPSWSAASVRCTNTSRLSSGRGRLLPLFGNEMAGEERLHALLVAATREVFPATAPVPSGDWMRQLGGIEQRVGVLEARAAAGVTVSEAFADAEELEASELNAVTELIIRHAGRGFSRLGTFIDRAGVDHHRDKLLEARRRLRIEDSSQFP